MPWTISNHDNTIASSPRNSSLFSSFQQPCSKSVVCLAALHSSHWFMWKNSTKIPSISERFFLSKSVAHLHAKYLVLKCWWWLKMCSPTLKMGTDLFSNRRSSSSSSRMSEKEQLQLQFGIVFAGMEGPFGWKRENQQSWTQAYNLFSLPW